MKPLVLEISYNSKTVGSSLDIKETTYNESDVWLLKSDIIVQFKQGTKKVESIVFLEV